MKLSEITRENLKINTRVWNAKKTQQGTLTQILPEDREDITLVVTWDNGKVSEAWHFWCCNLEIIEE